MRGALTYRPRDLTEALKAASKAGFPAKRFEIEPSGKIIVFVSDDDSSGSELSRWLESRARST